MTTWLFQCGLLKEVYVESDRWYEARQFAETYFQSGGHDGVTWMTAYPGARKANVPLFKLTWSGHAAGKHDNIKMTVTEIKGPR